MNILLVAINAKFIHSSLAIRSLMGYNKEISPHLDSVEYTINNATDYILADIFSKLPHVVCFSCYIWNIEMVTTIAENLKKIMPHITILCGGPEVSYDGELFLKQHNAIDLVLYGEGERTFGQVAKALIFKEDLQGLQGVIYRDHEKILTTPPPTPLSMDDLPFVYDSLDDMEHKIIYYETQRGCPYNCQFCLSSIEAGVRFLSLEKVYSQLDFFLKHKVRQVKFVDRTFNCNKKHAEAIWAYLMEHDNGVTNFHMEIEAHIMQDCTIDLLSKAREGLFQFEIGVQSTNILTLNAVKRNPDFPALAERIEKIRSLNHIHIHLDLIAGLPHESYRSFRKSFNDVYQLNPHQLQLGFLKVLKGSGLKEKADDYGLVYRAQTPYEILFTKDLSFSEMCRLKNLEEMVETYYNSGKALRSVTYMQTFFPSPFDFFERLADFWVAEGYHRIHHNKEALYTIIYDFAQKQTELMGHIPDIKEILRFDMLLCDNLNSMPQWLEDRRRNEADKLVSRKFFNDKEKIHLLLPQLIDYTPAQLSRMCRLEPFDAQVWGNFEATERAYILFNYYERDFLANHAKFTIVHL